VGCQRASDVLLCLFWSELGSKSDAQNTNAVRGSGQLMKSLSTPDSFVQERLKTRFT